MSITVRFYGPYRDAAGADAVELKAAGLKTVADVLQALAKRYPKMGPHLASANIALNHMSSDPMSPVKSGDTLALFPFVAGG